ncbi:hypothetical protein JQ543_21195 [Bradyrhizobium diazoefficiens]|nr:hypothetical protein [Bradyrhizobium diazoefficiens]MBR0850276.1 hypothetical protein [Bradyrhizobium diazoefficiens]
MESRKVEVRYSALSWFGYFVFCLGLALPMHYVAIQAGAHGWLNILMHVGSAVLVGVALLALYRFVTAVSGKVIISIDALGLRDARLSPAVIPWRAIRSVSSFVTSRRAPYLKLDMDPNFKLEVTRPAAISVWPTRSTPIAVVSARGLDVEADEIARIANKFLAESRLDEGV